MNCGDYRGQCGTNIWNLSAVLWGSLCNFILRYLHVVFENFLVRASNITSIAFHVSICEYAAKCSMFSYLKEKHHRVKGHNKGKVDKSIDN